MSYLFLSCTKIVLYQKDLSEAIEIAERIRNEIEKKSVYIDRNLSFNFTASFGVALSAENLSKDCVIRLADQALYLAKAKGRNQVCHYLEVSVLEN
ncbi:diguanylate cyclase [Acinetobacter gerneri]|uniref:diguanylate cyclase n=1 Tax=Acinetobacter gerneri TaxID=202952 RepID=UPI0029358044|nr:diguanylate cyclase [Acinetobacter gerneri]MDV2441860.1 diguanylate cyclase [Acinetobacter gerneri]